jgi:hypothetical protein
VGEETLRAAEAALPELREGLRGAESSRAALDERILSLIRAIERASKLREELEKQRAEHCSRKPFGSWSLVPRSGYGI